MRMRWIGILLFTCVGVEMVRGQDQSQLRQPHQPSRLGPEALTTIWSFNTYAATHFADGQGWTSTVNLIDLDSTQQCLSVQFFGNTGAAVPVPLVGYGSAQSSVRVCLAGLGSISLQSAGTSSPLVEGWARLACDPQESFCFGIGHIAGSIVFRNSTPGQPDLAAAVPFDDDSASHVALPFDNTNGSPTGLALTNPQTSQNVVTLIFHGQDGAQLYITAFSLASGQHTSYLVATAYPSVAGQRGVLEITSTAGLGVLALQVNPSGSFTTIFPVTSGAW